MKELTKAEEQIMQVLWNQGEAFVKDILDELPEPKPAYNTVSTIVRILEKKGFVAHNVYGNTHEYYPLITKDEYRSFYFKGFLDRYFSNSFEKLVSFFSKQEDLSPEELKEIQRIIKVQIKKQDEC